VVLRLTYLGVTNALAMLRLLAMSDRDKDLEILTLGHQITVLQRQLDSTKVRFTPADRAFLLAALLHRLPLQDAAHAAPAGAAGHSPALAPRSSRQAPRYPVPAPKPPAGHRPCTPSGGLLR
jgi:hypothetical protein